MKKNIYLKALMVLIVSTSVSANLLKEGKDFESLQQDFMMEHYSHDAGDVDTDKIMSSWEEMSDMLSDLLFAYGDDSNLELGTEMRAFIEDSLLILSNPLVDDLDKRTVAMKLDKYIEQYRGDDLYLNDSEKYLISSAILSSRSSTDESGSVPVSEASV